MSDDALIAWLLEGDPAIRWQVMRDLQDAHEPEWRAERERTLETGWVAELLRQQGRDGEWPKGRWTASMWTLLLLVALGLPEEHPSARKPLEGLIGRFMPEDEEVDGAFILKRVGPNLVGEANSAAFLIQVDQHAPALVRDALHRRVELRAAVAAGRMEDVARDTR